MTLARQDPSSVLDGTFLHRSPSGCIQSCAGHTRPCAAPVAQLDRALPSEGRGREFESRRVRQCFQVLTTNNGPARTGQSVVLVSAAVTPAGASPPLTIIYGCKPFRPAPRDARGRRSVL